MKLFAVPVLLIAAQTAGFAQLTLDQKLTDFRQLIGLFDKRYAPYDWKKQVLQVDLLDVQPWLDRVAKSENDLDYYDICIEYVTSLHDGNSYYIVPSDFRARLGVAVNVIQDQAIVSSVDRNLLPASKYPFDFGDIVVSLDGKSPRDWIAALLKYVPAGNERIAQQLAAGLMTDRFQQAVPHAVDVAGEASLVVRRSATGNIETYTIPWVKTGTPLAAGPVPSPKAKLPVRAEDDNPAPAGQLLPIYRLPEGFQQRLGRSPREAFFSGTYTAGGHKIGYLRIGTFAIQTGLELGQLDSEIAYFQDNTDGLVVDAWGTGGTTYCYSEELAARFFTNPFQTVGYALRATRDWISVFESRLSLAPSSQRDQAQANLDKVMAAYAQNRGLSEPVPLCSNTLTHAPAAHPYTKPVVLLVNELSAGPAELLAAMLQDAGRATIFGGATAGLGTTASAFDVGAYAEGYAIVSVSMAVRPGVVSAPGFPATSYIENIGVRPDVPYDMFTLENVAVLGVPYVQAFTETLIKAIESAGQ
jgi:hypothetical protein